MIGNSERVAVTYAGFAADLKIGNTVLVDDGLIGMEVTEVTENSVVCKVLNNGDRAKTKALTCRAFPSSCRRWRKKTNAT